MKKLASILILSMYSLSAFADGLPYKPTEKEKKAVEFLIKDDINVFFSGGDALFSKVNKDKYHFITPEKIQKEYDDNEVRADKKFKGKFLVISGTVSKIQSDIKDEPFVIFKTKQMFQSPQAKFVENEFDKVIELNKGEKISLVCIGAGEIAGTPMLKDCKFKKTVISDSVSESVAAYNQVLQGKVDPENEFINTLVLQTNIFQYTTNDFSKCPLDKFDSTCFNKSIDKKKEKILNEALEGGMPEQFMPLAEYLHIKKFE